MNTDKDRNISNRIVLALARTVFLFGLLTCGYVVAMQLRSTRLVYNTLAEWVPIRMDYLGEDAFILSMVAYFLLNGPRRRATKIAPTAKITVEDVLPMNGNSPPWAAFWATLVNSSEDMAVNSWV
jgi:hypothetical protein